MFFTHGQLDPFFKSQYIKKLKNKFIGFCLSKKTTKFKIFILTSEKKKTIKQYICKY